MIEIPNIIKTFDVSFYNLLNLLISDELKLPVSWDDKIDFLDFIEGKYNDFSRILKKYKFTDDLPKKLFKILKLALNDYFMGLTHSSFKIFREIKINKEIFSKWSNIYNPFEKENSNFEFYYRARKININHYTIQNKQDIFHIPFEKRLNVSSHRYSINGLPCLYLNTSIYGCWEELNRPDINWLYVSLFKFNGSKEDILDFSWSADSLLDFISKKSDWQYFLKDKNHGSEKLEDKLDELQEFIQNCKEWINNFIISWPLLMVCYIQMKNHTKPFKPHYIIPQFLTQLILEENTKYKGIKYFSTKIPSNLVVFPDIRIGDKRLILNLAFPVRTINKEGYCENLNKLFTYISPISYQSLITIKPTIFSGRFYTKPNIPVMAPIKLSYEESLFGEMEFILKESYIEHLLLNFWGDLGYSIKEGDTIYNLSLRCILNEFENLTFKEREEKIITILKESKTLDTKELDQSLYEKKFRDLHDNLYLKAI
jgi:hypothetical protein